MFSEISLNLCIMEMKKIIREKDGKVIEITEWAYEQMKKSSFAGYRDYKEVELSMPIKISKPTEEKKQPKTK